MLNKNKNTSERRGKRQRSHIDNQTESNVQKSTKSEIRDRDRGHYFQKVSTKILSLKKENMIMSLTKGLCSLKNAITENGIKYILHLLNFYLFNTISTIFFYFKKHIETKHAELCNKNNGRKNKWTQIDEKYTRQTIKTNNSNGSRLQNVEKYSDSSKNQSSNASNVTATNMPLNYKDIDSRISGTALKNPTDISTKKHSFNRTQIPVNVFQDTKSFVDELSNTIQNKFSKSYTEKQHSNSSTNKEIKRIFRQKFTSSDKMHSSSSFPKSFASYKYRKTRQTNSLHNGENKKFYDNSQIRSQFRNDKTEQKKEISIKFAPTNEQKKFTFDKERNEKHTEWRNKTETQEKRLRFQQHGPAKYRSYYSRVPMRNEESKRYNLKYYKEKGTQTDSVFPTDHSVKMVSVGTMCPEQQSYRCATHESQDRDMNQELNHIADNEELLRMANQQISSDSTPFSSTNFSSDAHTITAPDADIVNRLLPIDLLNSINTSKTPIRAPPGFPEVPQNSPLTFYIRNPEHCMPPSSENDYNPNSHIKPVTVVPSAPPSMQHHYYNYPQFMQLPNYGNYK